MKKLFFDCGSRESIPSAGLLVLRVGFGLMMLIGHGWSKIALFQDKKDSWEVPDLWPLCYMSPPVSMIATIVAEVGASALLILGLVTRPAAFLLGFTMVVAAFQVHADGPFFMKDGPGSKEMAVLYLIPCIVLIITGAGNASLDGLIYKEKKRRFF